MMPSSNSTIQILGTVAFALAVCHTFLVNQFTKISKKFPEHSVSHKCFTFLGEVEIVFGFWAFLFLVYMSYKMGIDAPVEFLDKTDFSEVIFIFAMMCMSYTKPVLDLANKLIDVAAAFLSKVIFLPKKLAIFYSIYILGALSGSFITEPAAMTVCALLLHKYFFKNTHNFHFKYALLGLLFVNVSIGGTLTTFSAPPVLMVAEPWGLTNSFLFKTLGWKTIIAVTLSTVFCSLIFMKSILKTKMDTIKNNKMSPITMIVINVGFLILAVTYHKYPSFVIPLFLLFLGFYEVTTEYQRQLKIRQSLLVSFFIGGIVILGALQSWWITPIIQSTNFHAILLGTAALTAVTDNAAITFIASQAAHIPAQIKYAFLAGAVAGGGLTVIANAPNPIGYGILNKEFGDNGIRPFFLLLWAIPPTSIALLCYLFL